MTTLSFVIWLIGYPLAYSISSYLWTLERKILGEEKLSESFIGIMAMFHLIFYCFIGNKLWGLM